MTWKEGFLSAKTLSVCEEDVLASLSKKDSSVVALVQMQEKQREDEQKRNEGEEAEASLIAEPEVLEAFIMRDIAQKASATRDGWGSVFREPLPASLEAEVMSQEGRRGWRRASRR